jgi:hypothetical protein
LPRLAFEQRAALDRAADEQPELEGLVSITDLQYESYGWRVHPFLEVVVIGGVAFSHYFTSGIMGRPITTSAAHPGTLTGVTPHDQRSP